MCVGGLLSLASSLLSTPPYPHKEYIVFIFIYFFYVFNFEENISFNTATHEKNFGEQTSLSVNLKNVILNDE